MPKVCRKFLVYTLAAGVFLLQLAASTPASAASGINQEINFQGRLLNSQGAVVADGYYNMEFKIYQDGDGQSVGDTTGSPAGTLKWTEDWINNGTTQGVKVQNGYMSVQLGSRQAFGTSVNWNSDTLWLSMQVGNTSTCTISTTFQANCGGDGEMTPMKRLSSTPYSLNSGLLQGLSSAQFIQLAQGVQTDNSTSSSIFINKTGASGNLAELQNNNTDVFTVGNGGATTIASVSATAGNAANALTVTGGNGASTATAGNGSNIILSAGNGGSGATANGNGGNITFSAGAAGSGAGTAGTAGSIVIKNVSNSATAFQVQNSTNSQPVLAVDTSNNQLVLGAPGASGLTGGIKFYYAGSAGSVTLAIANPGSSNFSLSIDPTGGGTICTTGNGLCVGGSGGGTGLAKNAVDTSQADAGTGYIYTFTNTGNAETGGVLALDNGNNTGPALFLKDTSTKAFQVQTSAGYNSLVLDNSVNPTHLKIYDGTATQAYADISYNDTSSSAIYTASTGTAQFGGGSVPTLLTAGSGQAVNITGHATSSWVLDSGNLTLDVTGTTPTMNIGTGAQAKTINIGNQTGTTAINIKGGSGNINFIPVGTGNTGVTVKATNASTLAFQVQNSTSSKAVMAVDTSGNQVVIGDSSSGGITGQLAFSYAGASGKILLKPNANPGASTFTLQLPNENGTLCSTAGSAACLAVYGGGSGSFLAKDAVDTSTAAAATNLYSFTNNSVGGTGGVLHLDNKNNTGSTLSATTSGNPDSGKAVIYAENTNAAPSGNLLDLEAGATPTSVFSVDATGKLTAGGTTLNGSSLIFGDGTGPSSVQAATSQALTITGHASSTWSLDAGDLTIETSAASSNLNLDSGAGGIVAVGNTNAGTINIGNLALASGTQTINIGTNTTSGGTTNITVGAGAGATGGITTIQSKGNTAIATNGVTRATFDTSGNLYLGNGTSSAAPANFTIRGTDSTTSGTAGSTVTIQGGSAGVGNANGGNVSITGGTGAGTGVSGLVLLSTPTFSTITADPNCYTGGGLVTNSCTIAQTSVDESASVIVGFSTESQIATLPAPTIPTPGRLIYITAANNSKDFTLEVNGGGTGNDIAMRQNTSATMVWSGSGWTAAGASSSTTLQAAYDNTLQSAGGAELVVSHTTATDGLTIRDSSINPVNGTLLSVQTNSAATIIAINGNVTEYASDAGAESAGGTVSTFPASTWSAIGGASVSRYTTVGNFINTGEASVSVATTTTAGDGVADTLSDALTANLHYNVSFAARLASGTFTDLDVYYSADGTTSSVVCTTGKAVTISIWTKVNCTFAAPASGITASNAILIHQTSGGTARNFYIDNLSVTIAADFNYATDGGVDDDLNFATNWTAVNGSTVSRNTAYGNDASDSAEADTATSGQGVRNKLSIDPLIKTLYRVTVYASSDSAGFDNFTVQYSPDGGTNFVGCADYNTQSVSDTPSVFVKITCYITTGTTTASNPYVYFTQTDNVTRSFYVDTFSITLSTDTTPNVQIGGGVNGGPVTLLTLDRAASAPIASNNDAFLGSMYYDTTLGKLQCYEADGWGACGSSPNNIVTISPEYTNAVMHGTGVGTMTSDICSGGSLHINDGTSGQPTICSSSETYNFYKWTSPQPSAQTYSIYVTYQLPDTFKAFASGQTSLMGRTDSTNATVQYSVYREDSTNGLTPCGTVVPVSTGVSAAWQVGPASGTADPSTCGFAPSNSIVFKIDVIASQDADAYVGNLNFTFSNK